MLIACLLSGVVAVYLILRGERYGWDYEMYCGSIMMVQAGHDPYLPRNTKRLLGTDWVLPYPTGALVLLSPACVKPRLLYPAFYSLVLLLAAASARRLWPGQTLLLAALLIGGLVATPYNYLTGNTGILELWVVIASLAASSAGRDARAGTWLGIVAAVKLTPLAFAAVFAAAAWRERGWRAAGRLGLGVASGFAIVHGLSLLIGPRYELSLVRALGGGFRNQAVAVGEIRAAWTNPALPLILRDAVALLGGPTALAYALYGALLLAGVTFLFGLWRRERDALTAWSYAMLLVCLLLPRFKPYSFSYALVPLFLLLRRKSPGRQALVMLLGTLLPVLAFRASLDRLVVSDLTRLLVEVNQMLALCAVFLLLVWWDRDRWRGAAPAASRAAAVPAGPGG